MEENPNYYAIIPSEVRYDKKLKPNEKLLYGEISALANKMGVCFAGNSYFSELYEVDKATVSRWITNLEKNGYVKRVIKYKKGTKEIAARGILINGIVKMDKLKYFYVKKGRASTPDWLGKEIEAQPMTEEELKEFEALLGID